MNARSAPRRLLFALLAVTCSLAWTAGALGAHPRIGLWDAWLDAPAGRLNFRFELTETTAGVIAELLNGSWNDMERQTVPLVEFADGRLSLIFDDYDSRIDASVSTPDGRQLVGTWKRRRGADEWSEMTFGAIFPGDHPMRIARSRFAVTFPLLEGRFSLKFAKENDPGVAVLTTRYITQIGKGEVSGTVLTTTGDYRYLRGEMEGASRSFSLSSFDGASAVMFRGIFEADGTLRGSFQSGDRYQDTFTAVRDDDAQLPDGFTLSRATPDADPLTLRFPDANGTIRSLGDDDLRGKGTILYVMGTWCHNCADATKLMNDLTSSYSQRGLRVVGLAFEVTGDPERDRNQLKVYSERRGVTFPLLLGGRSKKEEAARAFPVLEGGIKAYPTFVFVDKAGKVRTVYAGFTGPAAKGEHLELRRRFSEAVEGLLRE